VVENRAENVAKRPVGDARKSHNFFETFNDWMDNQFWVDFERRKLLNREL
jgi:hypothetical protein